MVPGIACFNEWAWRCGGVGGDRAGGVLPWQQVNIVGEIRLRDGVWEKEINLTNENETNKSLNAK